MSFSEYTAKNGSSSSLDYAKGVKEAYIKSRLSERDAQTSEAAADTGYLGSGYGEYLRERSEDDFDREISLLNEKRARSEKNEYSAYLSYLDDYEKRQKRLSDEVKDTLIRGNIADPGAAYTYAVSKGLGSEEAKKVSLAVYEVMRGMVISNIGERLADFKLSEEGAVTLAKSYGLTDEDVEYVRKLAKERRPNENYDGESLDEYLRELEKNADKVSSGK